MLSLYVFLIDVSFSSHQGAEEMQNMELLLNVYASRVAKGHVAKFLGYIKVWGGGDEGVMLLNLSESFCFCSCCVLDWVSCGGEGPPHHANKVCIEGP